VTKEENLAISSMVKYTAISVVVVLVVVVVVVLVVVVVVWIRNYKNKCIYSCGPKFAFCLLYFFPKKDERGKRGGRLLLLFCRR